MILGLCSLDSESPSPGHTKSRAAPSLQNDCVWPLTGPLPSSQVTESRCLAGATEHKRTEQGDPSTARADSWDPVRREGPLSFFAGLPGSQWSPIRMSPLTSEHGDIIHPPVLVLVMLTQNGTPVPPGVSLLGPFQPQRVVPQQFEPGCPYGPSRFWDWPGHLDLGHQGSGGACCRAAEPGQEFVSTQSGWCGTWQLHCLPKDYIDGLDIVCREGVL